METVHWVSNGSQSNLHHSRKHTDSAVYLVPVYKKCQLYDAQFMAIQKNYERLCQQGKAFNTERIVIKSERLSHKHCKFPILVIKIICNLSKKAENKRVLTVPKAVCKGTVSLQGPILSCRPMETSSSG